MAERIKVNTDVTITSGRSDDAATRNSRGRVFLEDGESFEVIVKTRTDETVVASGTASAVSGKLCAIYVTVRAEADVNEPVLEEPE